MADYTEQIFSILSQKLPFYTNEFSSQSLITNLSCNTLTGEITADISPADKTRIENWLASFSIPPTENVLVITGAFINQTATITDYFYGASTPDPIKSFSSFKIPKIVGKNSYKVGDVITLEGFVPAIYNSDFIIEDIENEYLVVYRQGFVPSEYPVITTGTYKVYFDSYGVNGAKYYVVNASPTQITLKIINSTDPVPYLTATEATLHYNFSIDRTRKIDGILSDGIAQDRNRLVLSTVSNSCHTNTKSNNTITDDAVYGGIADGHTGQIDTYTFILRYFVKLQSGDIYGSKIAESAFNLKKILITNIISGRYLVGNGGRLAIMNMEDSGVRTTDNVLSSGFEAFDFFIKVAMEYISTTSDLRSDDIVVFPVQSVAMEQKNIFTKLKTILNF